MMSVIVMAAVVFTSCEDDDEIFDPPTVLTSAGGTIILEEGVDEYTVNGTAQSSAPLMEIKLLEVTGDGEFQIGNSITEFADPLFHQFSFTITGIDSDITVKVRVTDTEYQDADTDPINIVYTPPSETPLTEASDTTWQRIAGADGTGLGDFGLAWTLNQKTTRAVISKDGAEKFVQLDEQAWDELETLEALMEEVEASEDMEDYRGVSAEAPATYNDVLATIYDGRYYLILVESATVESTDAGTLINISVQYKTSPQEEVEE